MVLGPAAVLGDDLQLALELRRELVGVRQLVLGEETGLDALGQLDLLLGVEEGNLADLLQVVLDRVGGGAGDGDLLGRRVVLVVVGEDEALVLALALLFLALARLDFLGGLVTFEQLVVLLAGLLRRCLLGRRLLRGGLLGSRLLGCRLLGGSGRDGVVGHRVRTLGRRGGGGRDGPGHGGLRRDGLGGGALDRALRCDALAGALRRLRGTDHQRHTLFLEDLVEAAQNVLPLGWRNLVSLEGPTHVIAGDLPISLSPLDERHHRLGLGDLRRERTGCAGRHEQPLGTMETASGPALERAGTDDRRLGMSPTARVRPQNCTAHPRAAVFLPRRSPLKSSRCFEECYGQSAWPESHRISGEPVHGRHPLTIVPPDPCGPAAPGAHIRPHPGQCSRGAGTTRSTSGWTTSS